ncbi:MULTISPECIES: NAD+ synthase [unclassified Cyanobium]|uniref:NAD+ synthase n=1 Tax=unclassified Cyanobium TaxID=2627006 RepID=UPI0020CD3559|nr:MULTISPECIES: NAD+ synthase [unclassified Cyanobium]MCP9858379.1 NAD+ synthase [Cyanobium sp. Cruz-8H5]MCP9865537.1 NAD+ synthase [Cyanobium sp. Cruz-8D1]
MRLALAQLNPLVGDLEGNGQRILAAAERARAGGADLVLTPELSLWGYPPRDLLLRPALIQRQEQVLASLAAACQDDLALLVGVAEPAVGRRQPGLYNALALVQRGRWRYVCRKRLLPTYDVFDERRYFLPGDAAAVLELEAGGRPWRLGLTICEDLWVEETLRSRWPDAVDPIADLVPSRIDLLLNLSASPFGRGKGEVRQALAARAAARLGAPVVYLNQVGGNDELVFDGASFVVDGAGRPLLRLACAAEDLGRWDAGPPAATSPGATTATTPAAPPDPWEQLLRVLVLGVRDYAAKCGFQRALLGLSGGIDSALVAVIAAAALGPERVEGLRMPSPFSSAGSLDDAAALAGRLGLRTATLPIAPLMEAFAAALSAELGAPPRGVTEENLQSRIRGTLLMAVANEKGGLLLSTGNKSELAVGYCTLYGDMNGGLAVIGDLYKTTISGLCDWLDGPASGPCRATLGLPSDAELIGVAIRTKPPSAELRPDQRDSDSLPDYAVLDPLLKACIEEMRTPEELVAQGADRELVDRVAGLLRRAEFKRRQAAPVLKVSDRAFGSGWRMPIASA